VTLPGLSSMKLGKWRGEENKNQLLGKRGKIVRKGGRQPERWTRGLEFPKKKVLRFGNLYGGRGWGGGFLEGRDKAGLGSV